MRCNVGYAKEMNKLNNKYNEILLEIVLDDLYPILIGYNDKVIDTLNLLYDDVQTLIKLKRNGSSDAEYSKVFKIATERTTNLYAELEESLKIQRKYFDKAKVLVNEHNYKTVCVQSKLLNKYRVCKSKQQFDSMLKLYQLDLKKRSEGIVIPLWEDAWASTSEMLRIVAKLNEKFTSMEDKRTISNVMEDAIQSVVEINKDYNSKIFSYKELNKLATQAGYVLERQSGDHGQFVKGGKTVTIPQGRPIGKGLSIKIQKEINKS